MSKPLENVSEGNLTETAFEKLLAALAPDPEVAGAKYVELRLRLRKFFAWKFCRESDLDGLVDVTLDRVEGKLGGGEVIENVEAYAGGVARYVQLEYARQPPPEPLIDPPDIPFNDSAEETGERYDCLEKCLATLAPQDRELILDYYDVEENEKNKEHRKNLAKRFGKSSGALKVYATRLREKLRQCIAACLKAGAV